MLKKSMKIFINITISIIISTIFIGIFYIASDYKPSDVEDIDIQNNTKNIIRKGQEFSIITYDSESFAFDESHDFFLEGGANSALSSKSALLNNMNKSIELLKQASPDIIFLQNLNINSTRSYRINEYDSIKNELDKYASVFSLDFKSIWIPTPFLSPVGKVTSGMSTISKYRIKLTERHSIPGNAKFYNKPFAKDMCFIASKIQVSGGHYLILINIDLSSYSTDSDFKQRQFKVLTDYINHEYKNGNYIIAGGNWGRKLPLSSSKEFISVEEEPLWLQDFPVNCIPVDFQLVYDEKVPTIRSLSMPYIKNKTYTGISDGFLISPNIEAKSVKAFDLSFKYSNHNPVLGTFILK